MIFVGNISTWVIVLVAIITVLLLAKETARKKKNRLFSRLVAVLIVIVAILGMLLKPAYTSETDKKLVVLTEGYDPKSVDSLYSIHNGLDSVHIDNFYGGNYAEVFLVGYGAKDYEYGSFEGHNVNFIAPELPQGVINVDYDNRPVVNTGWIIKGGVNSREECKVVLVTPEGARDSVFTNDYFQFNVQSRVAGRQLYHLEIWQDSLLVESNPLPVTVQPATSIRVMILNSFPTFESNHLKQFLALQHEVIVRNRISKDRFSFEYLNTGKINANQISSRLLSSIDVLVLDALEWNSLSRVEKNSIEHAVGSGMGLLLRDIKNKGMLNGFFNEAVLLIGKPADIKWQETKIGLGSLRLTNENGWLPILQNVSGYSHKGEGKLALMLAENTYHLNLRGDTVAYRDFWSKHINTISREERVSVEVNATMAMEGEPSSLNITYMEKGTPEVKVSNIVLPVIQNELFPERWLTTFWPDTVGWQEVHIDELSSDAYVYSHDDWKVMQGYNRILANNNYFKSRNNQPAQRISETKTINTIWFYLLFLIAISYLWLEAKL